MRPQAANFSARRIAGAASTLLWSRIMPASGVSRSLLPLSPRLIPQPASLNPLRPRSVNDLPFAAHSLWRENVATARTSPLVRSSAVVIARWRSPVRADCEPGLGAEPADDMVDRGTGQTMTLAGPVEIGEQRTGLGAAGPRARRPGQPGSVRARSPAPFVSAPCRGWRSGSPAARHPRCRAAPPRCGVSPNRAAGAAAPHRAAPLVRVARRQHRASHGTRRGPARAYHGQAALAHSRPTGPTRSTTRDRRVGQLDERT